MVPFRSKKYQKQQRRVSQQIEQTANHWIMHRDQLPEYRFALELMEQSEKEAVFWEYWSELDSFAQRDLARAAFGEQWFKLIADYGDLPLGKKAQALEALGHIHNENVVHFLMQELRKEDDYLRLAAASALKRQDPVLVIEPMLDALNKPEMFLAARVYDVLEALGPKLVPLLLKDIEHAEIGGRVVMVQLLGAFGDNSVLPVLEKALESDQYLLKKVTVEALLQLGTAETCPILARLLEDSNWQIRLLAVEAIQKGNFIQACPQLRTAFCKETDQLVKDMMEEALHELDGGTETITYLWSRKRSKHYGHGSSSGGVGIT